MSDKHEEIIDLLQNILTMQVMIHTELRKIEHVAQKHSGGGGLITDLQKQTLDNLARNRQGVIKAVQAKKP